MKIFDTIGSDPEFVVIDVEKNQPVSMVGIVGGTKGHPQPIQINGCCSLTDNVLVEFTIPPCKDFKGAFDYIKRCVNLTQIELQKINPNWELKAFSSVEFPEEELQSEQAQTFGCTPSFSLYTENERSKLISPVDTGNIRAVGYHLHFGWVDIPSEEELKDYVFLCDLFLGIPSYIHDKDRVRRNWYGALGEYRFTKFGIEFRSLGAGMYHSPKVIEKGLKHIEKAIDLNVVEHLKTMYWDTIKMISQTNILSPSTAKALHKEILNDLSLELV